MGNAVISAHAGARLVALETQIKRYERSYRRRLRKFTRTSSRHGDLLFTFPAIAFGLVAGRGTADQRAEAIGLVRDGAPLAHIASVLELPNWMRKLPPEAFRRPIGNVATGQAFGRKIIGRIPDDAHRAADWLLALETGLEAGDEDFAYWLAGQPIYALPFQGDAPVRPLAIYAWFSRQDGIRGRRMMDKAWTKQMHLRAAVHNMCVWFDRVMADLSRADVKRGPGRYSRRRSGQGYQLVRLCTAQDLDEEGRAMDNCVGSYAGMVAARECLIYSVRRGKQRVATLEVRWRDAARTQPWIAQLEGPGNTSVSPVVREATNTLLEDRNTFFSATPSAVANMSVDATRWKALWQPYVNDKGSKILRLERPDQRALANLMVDIGRLVHVAGR